MSSPYYNAGDASMPIVQGHAVSAPGGGYQTNHNPSSGDYNYHASATPQGNYSAHAQDVSEVFHGEPQPPQCRDMLWAVLFYVHLAAMAVVAIRYAPLMAQDVAADYVGGAYRKLASSSTSWWRGLEEEAEGGYDDNNYSAGDGEEAASLDLDLAALLTIIAFAGLAALLVSSAAIGLMMAFPKPLIKMALFFNLFLTGAMAVTSLLAGAIPAAVMMGLMFMVNLCYIKAVWSRIPFAASNLVTAISAVKSNMGLTFFAYNNLLLTFFWSIWWSVAFVATTYVVSNCNAEGYCENEMNGGLIFLFLVSFFWTAQVVKNVVHVTVAGTVGTWWLFPQEANGCCSSAVRDSYWRSVTTSFGSICLGSLIVALIQATREMVNAMRNQDDSMLLCIADCLLGCLEQLAEYFNKVRIDCETICLGVSLLERSKTHLFMFLYISVGLHLRGSVWLWIRRSLYERLESLQVSRMDCHHCRYTGGYRSHDAQFVRRTLDGSHRSHGGRGNATGRWHIGSSLFHWHADRLCLLQYPLWTHFQWSQCCHCPLCGKSRRICGQSPSVVTGNVEDVEGGVSYRFHVLIGGSDYSVVCFLWACRDYECTNSSLFIYG